MGRKIKDPPSKCQNIVVGWNDLLAVTSFHRDSVPPTRSLPSTVSCKLLCGKLYQGSCLTENPFQRSGSREAAREGPEIRKRTEPAEGT